MFINLRKEEAGMKTIKLRDEKEVLDSHQHANLEALRNLEENYQQLINRKNDLDEQIERMKSRQKDIEDSSSEYKNETTSLKKQLRALQEKHRDARLVCVLYSLDCLYAIISFKYYYTLLQVCVKTSSEILFYSCFIFRNMALEILVFHLSRIYLLSPSIFWV